jgi:hypothetical protein
MNHISIFLDCHLFIFSYFHIFKIARAVYAGRWEMGDVAVGGVVLQG